MAKRHLDTTNIPEKKILYASNRSLTTVSDKELCKQNLIAANNTRKQIAESINLAEIRELLVEDPKFYELTEIAEFLYDSSDCDSIAALLRNNKMTLDQSASTLNEFINCGGSINRSCSPGGRTYSRMINA